MTWTHYILVERQPTLPLVHLHNSGPHEKVNVTFEGQRIDVAGLDWNIASTLPNKEIHVLRS